MAKQLRALVPAPMWWVTNICTCKRVFHAFFWTLQAPSMCLVHRHTQGHKNLKFKAILKFENIMYNETGKGLTQSMIDESIEKNSLFEDFQDKKNYVQGTILKYEIYQY